MKFAHNGTSALRNNIISGFSKTREKQEDVNERKAVGEACKITSVKGESNHINRGL